MRVLQEFDEIFSCQFRQTAPCQCARRRGPPLRDRVEPAARSGERPGERGRQQRSRRATRHHHRTVRCASQAAAGPTVATLGASGPPLLFADRLAHNKFTPDSPVGAPDHSVVDQKPPRDSARPSLRCPIGALVAHLFRRRRRQLVMVDPLLISATTQRRRPFTRQPTSFFFFFFFFVLLLRSHLVHFRAHTSAHQTRSGRATITRTLGSAAASATRCAWQAVISSGVGLLSGGAHRTAAAIYAFFSVSPSSDRRDVGMLANPPRASRASGSRRSRRR